MGHAQAPTIIRQTLTGAATGTMPRDVMTLGGRPECANFVEKPSRSEQRLAPSKSVSEAKLGLFSSCGEEGRRRRDELRQFPQVLGGGRQQELVFGSARPTQAQSVEPEIALQMSEQHLDLLFAPGVRQRRPRSLRSHGPSHERLREWSVRSCVQARLGSTWT